MRTATEQAWRIAEVVEAAAPGLREVGAELSLAGQSVEVVRELAWLLGAEVRSQLYSALDLGRGPSIIEAMCTVVGGVTLRVQGVRPLAVADISFSAVGP